MADTNPRELSFWGWGYTDRFPDAAARRKLGRRLRMLLRFGRLDLRQPPRLEDVELPPSRLAPPASLEPLCNRRFADRVTPDKILRHYIGRKHASRPLP